jgi:two-component system phosphate regulon response regulator OmpR
MSETTSLAVQTPADNAAHVLIVEDDRRIRALLSRLLRENGYRATMAASALEARACMKSLAFDLIVLDVMMPGEDGFQLARSIRDSSAVPILMLTALAEPADRVRGLETGADDYLPKPFEPRELLLRIASILRRASPPVAPKSSVTVRFGPFTFHLERGELREGEEIVRLTDRERDMLRLLAESAGEIVTREALAGPTTPGNERTVDVQVNRLRRKIERDPANPAHLQTVRGAGYRLLLER